MTSKNIFCNLLKSNRAKSRLSQADISKILNITRQAYSNYETGKYLPPIENIILLSIILNVNLFEPFLNEVDYYRQHNKKEAKYE